MQAAMFERVSASARRVFLIVWKDRQVIRRGRTSEASAPLPM